MDIRNSGGITSALPAPRKAVKGEDKIWNYEGHWSSSSLQATISLKA